MIQLATWLTMSPTIITDGQTAALLRECSITWNQGEHATMRCERPIEHGTSGRIFSPFSKPTATEVDRDANTRKIGSVA
jgi:hypothetical protein